MIDIRFKSEHICKKEAVEAIYPQIRDYWELMDAVCRRIVKNV
ncbi:MAG: hypothetical protein WCB90_07050 [Methanosarcina sp.]